MISCVFEVSPAVPICMKFLVAFQLVYIFNKQVNVSFYASVLLLIMNFIIALSVTEQMR